MSQKEYLMSLGYDEIREIDPDGMIEDVLRFPEMCRDAFTPIVKEGREFEKIAVVGMGGSGIGGDMLESYLRYKSNYPVLVNKNYDLPKAIDEKTLLFVISYSGNTEETLSSFKEGIERGCEVLAISSNGELKKIANKKDISLLEVPGGIQPRAGFPYLFLPMVATLEEMGVLEVDGFDRAISNLEKLKNRLNPSVDEDNFAKKIAGFLKGSIPVIYSYDELSPVAYRWKCQLNENSKMFSIMNEFPELNHNEVVGWDYKLTRDFKIVVLKEKDPIEKMQKKIEVTGQVLDVEFKEVEVLGDSLISKLMTGVFIGDLVSVYLATLNEVDPTPVRRIDNIKERLYD
ncbi:bifunctional phosphoglucose/phosphomannose isomerase [archaeon SCG-AAA382B04]|nr:bifunctional phosphoglucose/phosphomannose isomerase [archaeon SCG-AAA382B04]